MVIFKVYVFFLKFYLHGPLPGRPHCPTLSYFVLLFSFDKKCPTFEPKIAQMSYFVLLLRVFVLLFNDGSRNDNF